MVSKSLNLSRSTFVPDQQLYELKLLPEDKQKKLEHLRLATLPDSDESIDNRQTPDARNRDEHHNTPSRWQLIGLRSDNLARAKFLSRIEGLETKRRLLCITQSAGIGKSIALMQFARLREQTPGQVVISLHISQLPINPENYLDGVEASSSGVPLLVQIVKEGLAKKQVDKFADSKQDQKIQDWLKMLARVGRLTITVDGLDEHPEKEEIVFQTNSGVQTIERGAVKRAEVLRQFLERYPKVHCAVAGRPHAITNTLWSALFAKHPNLTDNHHSDWEFCCVGFFDERQRRQVIGEKRYEQCQLVLANTSFSSRTLEVLRTLRVEIFKTIRSKADIYWHSIDQSLSLDREKHKQVSTGISQVLGITRQESLELLGAIAITILLWDDDPHENAASPSLNPYRKSKTESQQKGQIEQTRKKTDNVPELKSRVVRRLQRVGRWQSSGRDQIETKIDRLLELGIQFIEYQFFEQGDPKSVGWRNPEQRDFFAALWIATAATQEERNWFRSRFSIETRYADYRLNIGLIHFWRFFCGLPNEALGGDPYPGQETPGEWERWLDLSQSLYQPCADHPRPTELMYLAWANLMLRAGILRKRDWSEEDWQESTRIAQQLSDPTLKSRSSNAPSEENWAFQIVREFLSEYPKIRDERSTNGERTARGRICWEDLEDHWSACNSHDDLYFWCGHKSKSDNPERIVKLSSRFEMAAYPITNRLYALFDPHYLDVGANYHNECSPYQRGPVTSRTWYDATMASLFFHARLPSEWEWEYASRGVYRQEEREWIERGKSSQVNCWVPLEATQPMFFWGDEKERLSEFTWCYENSREEESAAEKLDWASIQDRHAHVVGKEAHRNGFGLYDMLGNVWEWTASRFSPGQARRVVRGGSFAIISDLIRCSHRLVSDPIDLNVSPGFRVARAPS